MTLRTWGKGRPDYSQNVALGVTRKGLVTQYQETTKIFLRSYISTDEWKYSLFPGVGPPLAAAASENLVDVGTGLPLPFTVPQGYVLTILYYSQSTSHPLQMSQYLDGMIIQNAFLHGMDVYFEQEIYAVGTGLIDPTAATSHTYNMKATNIGTTGLVGIIAAVGILKEVGTEPLTKKTVGCRVPGCKHTAVVPYDAKEWTCPAGHKTLYYDLPFGGKK